MTELLTKAFNELSKLSEKDQNSLASWILEEIKSEQRWSKMFTESQDVLGKMGEEALREAADGDTENMDPDML